MGAVILARLVQRMIGGSTRSRGTGEIVDDTEQPSRSTAARHAARLGASLLAVIAAAASAQTADGPLNPPAETGVAAAPGPGTTAGGQIEEITVTAQKRSENLQSVPIAITAFTPRRWRRRASPTSRALVSSRQRSRSSAPRPSRGSSQVLSAFIRGIGQNDFAFNLDPGVGVYVDGVYYARTVGAVVDLLDLDHVEILKGPQGTLFGRNTIGGAISVVTRDPGNTFSGAGDVHLRLVQPRRHPRPVDIPLIDDKLLAQVSFSAKTPDGYFHFLTSRHL